MLYFVIVICAMSMVGPKQSLKFHFLKPWPQMAVTLTGAGKMEVDGLGYKCVDIAELHGQISQLSDRDSHRK